MNHDFYSNIGFSFVWGMKYIFIPIIVAVVAIVTADKLIKPQPKRQRKKRSIKNRFK